MYTSILKCKACGAKLDVSNIETDIYGVSKIKCEYCRIVTILNNSNTINMNGSKIKPSIAVLDIDSNKAIVTINGLNKIVNSEDLKIALLNDTIELDILSRARIAKVFNIDLEALASDIRERNRKESLKDFLSSLEEIGEKSCT